MNILHYIFIIIAAALDVAANLLMEKSDGFKQKRFGIPALFLICLAFTLLAQATQTIDLAVAYISWGAMAILGTVFSARLMFGQKLNLLGWLGIIMVFSSILLLNTSMADSFVLRSPDFSHQQAMDRVYTCEGKDQSPALEWSGLPQGTQSLALIVNDPDAPDPAAPNPR